MQRRVFLKNFVLHFLFPGVRFGVCFLTRFFIRSNFVLRWTGLSDHDNTHLQLVHAREPLVELRI